MENEKARQIFEAIKNDNLKEFSSVFDVQENSNLSFGRFPVLSVMYLFGAYSILSKYEKYLIRVGNFVETYEPFEIYKKFKTKAGKSLRFFACGDLKCYPVLMLAVLNEDELLKKKYKKLYKTVEISQILTKIYNLNAKIEINIIDDKLTIPKRKTKQKPCFILTSIFLAVVISLSSFSLLFVSKKYGLGISSSPIMVSTEGDLISALKSDNKYYKLKNDIELVGAEQVENFSGILDGGGYTITIKNQQHALIKNLTGTVKNLKIEAENMVGEISQNFAILAEKVEGFAVNLYISLKIDVNFNVSEDTYLTMVTVENHGIIDQVSIDLFGEAKNDGTKNCYVSGVVGENYGTIKNSVTYSNDLTADTVDISGIAISNYGTISHCYNSLRMTQVSNKEWHPNVSGISNANSGTIDSCANYASLTAKSTLQTLPKNESESESQIYVLAGGISTQNTGTISNSRNFGDIKTYAVVATCYSGGIVAQHIVGSESDCAISKSKAKCSLTASSEKGQAYIGGISAFSSGSISNSAFEGDIFMDSSSNAFCGGLVGLNNYDYNGEGVGVVRNSYAVPVFNLINSENSEKIFNFGLIGLVQTTANVFPCSNCYYVKNDSFAIDGTNYPGCYTAYSFFGSMSFRAVSDSESGALGIDSIDKIDKGLVINDGI